MTKSLLLVSNEDNKFELPDVGESFEYTLDDFFTPMSVIGLLWGQGDERALARGPRSDGSWVAVEVNEADLTPHGQHNGSTAYWSAPRGRVVRNGSFVDVATFVNAAAPFQTEKVEQWGALSSWPHETYVVDLASRTGDPNLDEDYNADDLRERVKMPMGPLANCYSSEIQGEVERWEFTGEVWDFGVKKTMNKGWHTVAIDVDHPVRVIESSTPGHYHLLIDVPMPWFRYRRLLKALKGAGIIEPGYYSASVRRRATFLRLPWTKK